MQVKYLSIGDKRPLRSFLSDVSVRIRDVKTIGKLSSAKDFELCLVYEIEPEKTSGNDFRIFRGSSMGGGINGILSRDAVSNLHISPYATHQTSGWVFFWEERASQVPATSDA